MRGKIRSGLGVFTALLLAAIPAPCQGEGRETNAVAATSTLLTRPKEFKPADAAYRDYFAVKDEIIQREFQKRWMLPDGRSRFGSTAWEGPRVTDIGSVDGSEDVDESQARSEFAQQVFRMRLESALNSYLASRARAPQLRKAQRVMNTLKNQRFRLPGGGSKAGKKSGEIRMGYNVITDYSRLEYVDQGFIAGLYHPKLLGSLTGSPSSEGASLRVSTDLGVGLPSAWASYPLDGRYVETGLRKNFSPAVSGALYSIQPINSTVPESYHLRLTYRF